MRKSFTLHWDGRPGRTSTSRGRVGTSNWTPCAAIRPDDRGAVGSFRPRTTSPDLDRPLGRRGWTVVESPNVREPTSRTATDRRPGNRDIWAWFVCRHRRIGFRGHACGMASMDPPSRTDNSRSAPLGGWRGYARTTWGQWGRSHSTAVPAARRGTGRRSWQAFGQTSWTVARSGRAWTRRAAAPGPWGWTTSRSPVIPRATS